MYVCMYSLFKIGYKYIVIGYNEHIAAILRQADAGQLPKLKYVLNEMKT